MGDIAARSERALPYASPDEQDRCRGSARDRRPRGAETLFAPALRQTDHEQAGARGGSDDRVRARLDDQRPGLERGVLLKQQRRVGEPPCDPCAVVRAGGCPEHLQRRTGRRREPAAELERGPVVVGTAERHDHR